MFDKILKGFVDIIYGTNRKRRNFELKNADEKVLAADASKGIITNESQEITRGINWVTSQRAVLMLTNKNIICGKWIVPLDIIRTAKLTKISSLFGNGQVLTIETKDNKNYQFGMQINPEWINQDALPLKLEKGNVKNLLFSIILRIIILGYIVYQIYRRFG